MNIIQKRLLVIKFLNLSAYSFGGTHDTSGDMNVLEI